MGSIRKIFGRAISVASAPINGQVLKADNTQASGVKWAAETSFELPAASSTGQVLKATGTGVGQYAWGVDNDTLFSLPAPGSTGQVLKATGTNVGDYTWGVDNDTLFSLPAPASVGQVLKSTGTNVGDYTWSSVVAIKEIIQVTVTGNVTVPAGATNCLAIGKGGDSASGNVGLNVSLGGVAVSISTVSAVTAGTSMPCVVGAAGTVGNSGQDTTFNSLTFPGAGYSIVSGTAFQGGAFASPTVGFLTLVFY